MNWRTAPLNSARALTREGPSTRPSRTDHPRRPGGKEAVKTDRDDLKVKATWQAAISRPGRGGCRAYGFAGVITKPYDLQTLSRTLRTVLS
jgi:hypothetical protein